MPVGVPTKGFPPDPRMAAFYPFLGFVSCNGYFGSDGLMSLSWPLVVPGTFSLPYALTRAQFLASSRIGGSAITSLTPIIIALPVEPLNIMATVSNFAPSLSPLSVSA